MRLPELLGVIGALVVGAVLAVFLLSSALGEQPALPTPFPPSLAPPPSLARVSVPPSTAPASGPLTSATPGAALVVGQKAPALEVALLDGSTMNTDDFLGKPMWVSFMATWTPQSPAELAMMSDYAGLLGDQMNELVIDVGEDSPTVKSFIKDQKFDLPVGVDSNGIAQAAWGAHALPVHYLLDAQGVVQNIVYGGAPPEIFIQAITDVVPDFSAEAPTPVPSLLITLAPETLPAETPTPAQ